MTLSYHKTNIDSKKLLLDLSRQKFKGSATPLADYVEYLKSILPYFKMLSWDLMPADDGFITTILDDGKLLQSKIISDVQKARLGHGWLANICYSFSSAVEHASQYNDYFRGSLEHHILLLLLDEYLRQSENYFSEGLAGIFYKSKDLMPITLPANRMFKKALLLWKEMQNGNRHVYIPFDDTPATHLYNKGILAISSNKIERRCYAEAQVIKEAVREVLVSTQRLGVDVFEQSKHDLLVELDKDPYYACLFVSKIMHSFFSWEKGCQQDLDELFTIKKECSTLIPLVASLCSMIKWVIKNTPDAISSMINHMMLSSSNFIEENTNRFGSILPEDYSRLFVEPNLTFDEMDFKDNITTLIGMSDNSPFLTQAARVFNTCYEYLQKMEKWSLQNDVKYPIKDIALNKNVVYFYKQKGFDSLSAYRNFIKSNVSNFGHIHN